MAKGFQEIREEVIKAVLTKNERKLDSIINNKTIMKSLVSENKTSKDILDLSSFRVEKNGKEYSLLGLAIENINLPIFRALAFLGFHPLTPAYTQDGKEVSILSALKNKTEEVEDDFDKSLEIGDINFDVYTKSILTIDVKDLAQSFEDYANGEKDAIADRKLFEVMFFYNYNIYTCAAEFEHDNVKYYPAEYLLKNHKDDLIPKREINKCSDSLIPYHGIDVDSLVDEVLRQRYIYETPGMRTSMIREDGLYKIDEILKSIEMEDKYKKVIEIQNDNSLKYLVKK